MLYVISPQITGKMIAVINIINHMVEFQMHQQFLNNERGAGRL